MCTSIKQRCIRGNLQPLNLRLTRDSSAVSSVTDEPDNLSCRLSCLGYRLRPPSFPNPIEMTSRPNNCNKPYSPYISSLIASRFDSCRDHNARNSVTGTRIIPALRPYRIGCGRKVEGASPWPKAQFSAWRLPRLPLASCWILLHYKVNPALLLGAALYSE